MGSILATAADESICRAVSRSSLLAGRTALERAPLVAALVDAAQTGVLTPEAVGSACVSAPRPASAFGLLVSCSDPCWRRHRSAQVDAYWPELAPRAALAAAYAARQCPWSVFVAQYWADLNALPLATALRLVVTLVERLSRYRTLLLLGERRAPGGDERHVRDPRVVTRAWLLTAVAEAQQIAREDGRRHTWAQRWRAA